MLTRLTEAVRRPGLDPGYGGIEANYAVPTSFTMDSGSGARTTGVLGFWLGDWNGGVVEIRVWCSK